MSILSDKAIKEQLLKSGFLVDYAEHLTEEELQWWRDMCEAAYRETLKMVENTFVTGVIQGELYKDREPVFCIDKETWKELNKLEVSNGSRK